jgi:hypothetical protein
MDDVGVHCLVLALRPQARTRLDHGAVGKPLVRLRADQHSATGARPSSRAPVFTVSPTSGYATWALATDLDG